MIRTLLRTTIPAAAIILSMTAFADKAEFGTADEAKAMLTKAVAAVKADKAKALAMFNNGEGGFLDRDLYPFCFNASDGKITAVAPARASLLGQDVRNNKDKTGKEFGKELYAAVKDHKEGELTQVSYLFPRPGSDPTPVPKVSFVTRVGDQGCGVGYYAK